MSADRSTKEAVTIGGYFYSALMKKLKGRGELILLDNEPRLGRVLEVAKCGPHFIQLVPPPLQLLQLPTTGGAISKSNLLGLSSKLLDQG